MHLLRSMWSLAISVAVIFVLWLAGQALGFHVSLLASLALTVGLTLIVALVAGALRHRREVNRFGS